MHRRCPRTGWLLQPNKSPSPSKTCAWCVDRIAAGRPAGAGGLMRPGGGAGHCTLMPGPLGATGGPSSRMLAGNGPTPIADMPPLAGAGVALTPMADMPRPAGAGGGPMPTPDMPHPAGAGGGPTLVGVSIGRSTLSPEDRISATPAGAGGA